MERGTRTCTMHMYPQGLIWRTADGSDGSFRNNEQKGVA